MRGLVDFVQEDALQMEMATHSSSLAWEIPWTEEPGMLQVHGVTKESDRTEYTHMLTYRKRAMIIE